MYYTDSPQNLVGPRKIRFSLAVLRISPKHRIRAVVKISNDGEAL